MLQTTLSDSLPAVKTAAQNESAYALIQELVAAYLVDFESQMGFASPLSYEEVLDIYVEKWEATGHDFTGLHTPAVDDDYIDAYGQQFSGISQF